MSLARVLRDFSESMTLPKAKAVGFASDDEREAGEEVLMHNGKPHKAKRNKRGRIIQYIPL